MSEPIRTPEDERPVPFLYPPFAPGRIYHAATYAGHSSGAVDMNRRSPSGAWMQDEGDPVLAAQDGKVLEVIKADGLVRLGHGDGWQTAYRHMRNIGVKVGDQVERGDQLGEVGNVAGSGSSFGPHLHFVVTRNGKPVQARLDGKPIATSVTDSDSKPPTWKPPAPVAVVGPPPKATWQSAFREAAKRLERAEERIAAKDGRIALLTEEALNNKVTIESLVAEGVAAKARIAELEAATPPDCSAAIAEAVKPWEAQVAQLEQDLAEFEPIVDPVYVRRPAA